MSTAEIVKDPMTTVDDRPRTKTRLRGVAPVEVAPPSSLPKTIGRYEVLQVIGKGAMGVVYKARDPLLDRTVAVKTIVAPASLGRNVRKAFLERFEREAKAAARISHPAIVTIFDVGLEAQSPFLVMEYLAGETLADRLDRLRMPLAQAVQIARDLASALGFAHRERIVHRDVKPANVLHAGDTRWKLADFGIARLPDSDLTQIGIFMGTPGYAPPEAIREGRYTVQADVFAWGAVFYELLCGRVPYEGPDTQTTNGYVLKAEPPSPRTYDAGVPEPLAQIALRAMAHDTRRRFANGAEAEQALAETWERCLASGLVPLTAFTANAGPSPYASGSTGPVGPGGGAAAASPPPLPPAARAEAPRTDVPTVPYADAALPTVGLPHQAATSPAAAQAVPTPIQAGVEPSARLKMAAAVVSAQASRARDDSAQVMRTPVPGAPSPQEASSRLWIIVSLLLALAAAGAVAAFYLIRG